MHEWDSTDPRLDAQNESDLSKQEIAKLVQAQLNTEYAERAFQTIENSHELEQLSPGLGRLLVAQARAILTMKSVAEKLNTDLDNHLKAVCVLRLKRLPLPSFFLIQTREKLLREHPIKSKISRWMKRQLLQERLSYVHQREWDAHLKSIEQCKALGNQQAAYFIQRDLTFRKDVKNSFLSSLEQSLLFFFSFFAAWIHSSSEFETPSWTD